MVKSLPISESISFGWKKATASFLFFLQVLGILILVSIVFSMVNAALGKGSENISPMNGFLILIVSLINAVVQLGIDIGITRIGLTFVDNKTPAVSQLFKPWDSNLILRYLGGAVLYGLIVFGGMLLFVVPGIIWAIKFQYYKYLIVDKGLGPVEALKASSALTQGYKWSLFGYAILMVLVNILGMVALVIGLFWSIPTTMISNAFIFRWLEKNRQTA